MKNLAALIIFCLSFSVLANSNQWEGVPLSEFELKDQHGEIRTNGDFKGQWLVLYFYPKDKTPGCTVEAQNFTTDYPLYQQLNTQIVGVSYDDVASHKDFADTYEMPFTLLADTDKTLAKALKVDRILPWPHASRQTFLVNPDGIIVHHVEDVTPKTHSREMLEIIKRRQAESQSDKS